MVSCDERRGSKTSLAHECKQRRPSGSSADAVSGVSSWQYALPRRPDTAAIGQLTISLDSAKGPSEIYGIFSDDPYWEEDANLKLSYCLHRVAPPALRTYVRELPDQSANVVRPSKCAPTGR